MSILLFEKQGIPPGGKGSTPEFGRGSKSKEDRAGKEIRMM